LASHTDSSKSSITSQQESEKSAVRLAHVEAHVTTVSEETQRLHEENEQNKAEIAELRRMLMEKNSVAKRT
jgi:hypothetical protein